MRDEQKSLARQMRDDHAKLQPIVANPNIAGNLSGLSEIQSRLETADRRSQQITSELAVLAAQKIDDQQITNVLAGFDELWQTLSVRRVPAPGGVFFLWASEPAIASTGIISQKRDTYIAMPNAELATVASDRPQFLSSSTRSQFDGSGGSSRPSTHHLARVWHAGLGDGFGYRCELETSDFFSAVAKRLLTGTL